MEIHNLAFIAIGLVVLISSLIINWQKLFLFILVGIGFIIYGLIKRKFSKPKQPKITQNPIK